MSIIDTLVFDRTAADVAALNAKGTYRAADLNRVDGAMRYLQQVLAAAAYPVQLQPLIIQRPEADEPGPWVEEDEPNEEDLAISLSNLAVLKGVLPLLPTTPESPADYEGFTYEAANDIERILADLDSVLTSMQMIYLRAGVPWNVAGNNYYIRN